MNWNPDHAQNVRDYSSGGDYYTHDITDMSGHLNGWCLWTNFPSPYYDWDDDDNDGKWEETEVVADDTNFPVDNQYYSVNSYFTRWHWVCEWHGGGGTATGNTKVEVVMLKSHRLYRIGVGHPMMDGDTKQHITTAIPPLPAMEVSRLEVELYGK
jgi:hypothetical protein